jgi:hypothetical protein
VIPRPVPAGRRERSSKPGQNKSIGDWSRDAPGTLGIGPSGGPARDRGSLTDPGAAEDVDTAPLPPSDGRHVDDTDTWVERTAVDLGRALADPAVRAEVLALLDGHERDRVRRLEAARAELDGLELRWRLQPEEEQDHAGS